MSKRAFSSFIIHGTSLFSDPLASVQTGNILFLLTSLISVSSHPKLYSLPFKCLHIIILSSVFLMPLSKSTYLYFFHWIVVTDHFIGTYVEGGVAHFIKDEEGIPTCTNGWEWKLKPALWLHRWSHAGALIFQEAHSFQSKSKRGYCKLVFGNFWSFFNYSFHYFLFHYSEWSKEDRELLAIRNTRTTNHFFFIYMFFIYSLGT